MNLSWALTLLYLLDRALKLLAIAAFFRRPRPPAPARWPSVTIISPITRARHDLRLPLAARAQLAYPSPQQHLIVCDAGDLATQALVREVLAQHPAWPATMLLAEPDCGSIASKIAKLNVALAQASGELLVFVDDDVSLRPDALSVLLPYLDQPGAGAVFGLACYTAWQNLPSSLLSGFVNANALTSYIPLSYLTEPYTITGHCFALRRELFERIGGLSGMEQRIDDDHELARRVRAAGLRCVQTPLVYEVANPLPTLAAANAQLKRWFVFPRQAMLPFLSRRESLLTALASLGNLLPPLVFGLSIVRWLAGTANGSPPPTIHRPPSIVLAAFYASYAIGEGYLGRRTPWRRWPLLLLTALLNPPHILALLAGGTEIEWRGQRLRALPGGKFELIAGRTSTD